MSRLGEPAVRTRPAGVLRVIPTLAALALIILTVSLGNWQMRRAAEKEQAQQRLDQAAAAPPLVLGSARRLGPDDLNRRVSLVGEWLSAHTVFVDNRTWRGHAGFHVVTPVKIEGSGQVVLVLRGWVRGDPAQRNRLPDLGAAAERVRIEARVEADFPQTLELSRGAVPGPEDRLWQNISRARFEAWSGVTVAPAILRQTAAMPDDQLIREWVLPGSGVDKHHAYAAQWYGLALLVAGLWIGLTVRRKSGKAS